MTAVDHEVRTARHNTRLLYAATLFGSLNFQAAFWVLVLTGRGFDLRDVGILYAALSLAMLVAEVPLGVLADRVGKRLVVLAGYLLVGGYMAIMAFGAPYGLVLAAFILFGIGNACISGAELALLVNSRPDESGRTRVIGRYYAFSTTGNALGLAAGGAIAHFDVDGVFYGGMVVALLAAGAIFAVHEPKLDAEQHGSVRGHLDIAWGLLRRGPVLGPLMVSLGLYVAFVSWVYYFGQDLLHGIGAGPLAIAATYTAATVAGVVVATRAERIEQRFGRGRAIGIGGVATCLLCAALGLAAPVLVLCAVFVLIQVLEHVVEPLGDSMLLKQVPETHGATILSVLSVSTALFGIVSAPILGALSDGAGMDTVLGWSGVIVAVLFALGLVCFRQIRRNAATSIAGAPVAVHPEYVMRGEPR